MPAMTSVVTAVIAAYVATRRGCCRLSPVELYTSATAVATNKCGCQERSPGMWSTSHNEASGGDDGLRHHMIVAMPGATAAVSD